ncbi:MAG: hydroxymethylglutaryl-CoA reductase, degradative [Anaerolineales bacterium]|nr:hydroxymethylglutaryl-CoA reductase, degradative [Anaerolineales bacterium]
MTTTSRLEGFYRLSVSERQRRLTDRYNLTEDEIAALTNGGLSLELANRLIENVVGIHGLPLGIATNFQINGRDYLIPMAIEEPSVVAAASHAAKLVRTTGGFSASADKSLMIGQVQVVDLDDVDAARDKILAARAEILKLADSKSTLVEFGGGARDVQARVMRDTRVGPMLIVHLIVDVRDAMGANSVNTSCETIAPFIEKLTGGRVVLRILSNLADKRVARAECRVKKEDIGDDVARNIVAADALAEVDPYRATTHNKGIMNGIDAVVVATGNDWRAIEAGAHAYAARSGQYRALTTWDRDQNGDLVGSIELPIVSGVLGGTVNAHPLARIALEILDVKTAPEFAGVLASVGLAQNLGALRALAAEGIQQGHMALHARQVAISAGATGAQIDRVAEQMVAEKKISLARAKESLEKASRQVNK